MALTGLMSILVFIAPFSLAQGDRNQCVNTEFTRPDNEIRKSNADTDGLLFVGLFAGGGAAWRRVVLTSSS